MMNISVAFDKISPEEFFKLVDQSKKYKLMWNDEMVREISAKELWDTIIKNFLSKGEPGILNLHYSNQMNSLAYYKPITGTNPCVTGDTWVHTYDGPRMVKHLLGKKFVAIVDGKAYFIEKGFFHTGKKNVYKLKTKEGFNLKLTLDHEIYKKNKHGEFERTELRGIEPGDVIALNDHRDFGEWSGGDFSPSGNRLSTTDEGYLVGCFVGDGNFTDKKAELRFWIDKDIGSRSMMNRANKILVERWGEREVQERPNYWNHISSKLTEIVNVLGMFDTDTKKNMFCVEEQSSGFYQGFLRGLFDTDGSVQGDQQNGVSIRLSQSDLDLLESVQRMLLRFGIVSKIYKRRPEQEKMLPDGHGGSKLYDCKEQYELVVSKENMQRFNQMVGFEHGKKQTLLNQALDSYKRKMNQETFTARVSEIECVGLEDVFDVQVPGVNAFDANGIYVHNCGEVIGVDNSVCCLGSLVLPNFMKRTNIDWNQLDVTIRRSVRFLDNIIDITNYPTKIIEDESKNIRKIGLGITGLHDILLMNDIKYGSDKGLEFIEKMMQFIRNKSYETSTYIANEKGSFPMFKADEYLSCGFAKTLKPSLRAKIKEFGLRNSTLNTIAPNGTISMLIGSCSSGCEPIFGAAYKTKRWHKESEKTKHDIIEETVFHPLFDDAMQKGQDVSAFQSIDDITIEEHFKVQHTLQKYIDQSISKTILLQKTSGGNISKINIFHECFKKYFPELKGITVYVQGSRENEPIVPIPTSEAVKLWKETKAGCKTVEGKSMDACKDGKCDL